MTEMKVNNAVSKYNGLQKIDMFGLPHPDWRFVDKTGLLPDMPWCIANHGWTIRCAPKSAYVFGLPSEHKVLFDNIHSAICKLKKQLPEIKDYVVYPSWEFDVSGTCLINSYQLIIEIVKGDIAPLLSGQTSPDASYCYNLPYYQKPVYVNDAANLILRNDLIKLISSSRKIYTETEVVLEWTKTTEGRILFHDWYELIKIRKY